MIKRKLYFYCYLFLTVGVVILLVTGSSLLNIALDNDETIPSGTLITWTGMISLPLSIYWGIKGLREPSNKLSRILSVLIKTLIILAILWIPISFLLAGNFSFSFSEKETFQGGQNAMKWFWGLSYGIGIGAIFITLTYWISLVFKNETTAINKS